MSNHIDRIQEIEQRLDFVNGLVLTGWVEKTLRDDIAYLLSQVEFWKKAAETQMENNLAILNEHRAMKGALKWYAEQINWEYFVDNSAPVMIDQGRRARIALSHLKGE